MMTAQEQLQRLWKMTSHKDLAVSAPLLAQFVEEMVDLTRYLPAPVMRPVLKVEQYPGLQVTHTSLCYRDRHLVLVESV